MVFNDLVKPFAGAVALAIAPVLLAVAVYAQTAPPAPGQAPAAGKMEPAPVPAPAPAAKAQPGGYGSAAEGAGAVPSDKSAAPAPGKSASSDPLLGLEVIGSDGKSVGEVASVKTGPDGKVSEIHVKTGTFLGFGGETVAIPAEKVTKSGETLKVAMSSVDIGKLPKLDVQG